MTGRWQSNLHVFVFLLGLGVLIHKSHLPDPLTSPWPILATLFAIAALWRPDVKVVGFGLLAAVVAENLWFWPYIVNHAAFLLFACPVAIVSMVRMSRMPSPADRDNELESHLFPALRTGVYALFGFAVLHKLNHGFLDPGVSCALSHYDSLVDGLPVFAASRDLLGGGLVIYGTLLAEASIPVLLFFRRTRMVGLGAAFVFHFLMGINGHQAFSGYAPAIYLPFLPLSFHELLAAHALDLRARRTTSWMRFLIPVVGATLGVLVLVAAITDRYMRVRQLGLATFVLVIPGLFALFLFLSFRSKARDRAPTSAPARTPPRPLAVAWILLAVLGVNSMTPYLGLSTQTSFSMYSNLRTADDEWNHLFLPMSLRVASYQDSLVTVLETQSTEGTLARAARTGDRLVPFEVRRAISASCVGGGPLALRLMIAGEVLSYGDACVQRPLGGPNHAAAEKLLRFRPEPALNICRQ